MAEVPLDQAVARFKTNESNVDSFVNGAEADDAYTPTGGGPAVPTIRKLLSTLNAAAAVTATGLNRAAAMASQAAAALSASLASGFSSTASTAATSAASASGSAAASAAAAQGFATAALSIMDSFNSIAAGVNTGLVSATIGAAGTGGANGTFTRQVTVANGAPSGPGSGGSAATLSITVSGGAITAASITVAGSNYLKGNITLPNSFLALMSTGLTGASVVVAAGGGVQFTKSFALTQGQRSGFLADLYQNNAGTAALLGGIGQGTDAIRSLTVDTGEPATFFTDRNGNVAGRINPDGQLDWHTFTAVDSTASRMLKSDGVIVNGDLQIAIGDSTVYSEQRCDRNGNVNYRVRASDGGIEQVAADPMPDLSGLSLPFAIEYLPHYGQSESVGFLSVPAVSTVNKYADLMFNTAGTRVQDDTGVPLATLYGSLVPLAESDQTFGAGNYGETPCSGTVEMVHQMIADENGVPGAEQGFQLLACSAGQGSSTLATLSKGGSVYPNLTNQITYGASLAAAAGATFGFRMVCFTQGNHDELGDTPYATYLSQIKQFRLDLSNDRATILGNAYTLQMSVCQDNSDKANLNTRPNVALAQLQASRDDPNIHIACVHYLFDTVDAIHIVNTNTKWLGMYHGIVFKRVVLEGKTWTGVRPKANSGMRSGTTATLDFDVQVGKLVFDTSRVSDPGNYGFTLVTAADVDIPLTVKPQLVGPKRIKFTAGSTIPAGAKIRYGFNSVGATTNRSLGPRGCLRDQQGDYMPRFDPTGINAPTHNYCVIFEETLP